MAAAGARPRPSAVADDLPLIRRFPPLARLPRASFGTFPTPISKVALDDERTLLIKRDDLTGSGIGGNKIRALEWLLGRVERSDEVLTVGPTGSTHALATAACAARLGATTTVVRWPQEMNPAAQRVDARLRSIARVIDVTHVVMAYAVVAWMRLQRRVHWVPAGGTTPLGIFGYVNAALELAEQIDAGESAKPDEIVVPLGTGGTAAGIALGLGIAGLRCRVSAVRVAPRVIASRGHMLRLVGRTRRLLEIVANQPVAFASPPDLGVTSDFYGGGYGRPLPMLPHERGLAARGIRLDDTYSRKAFAAAAAGQGNSSLLWLTFDGRLLQD